MGYRYSQILVLMILFSSSILPGYCSLVTSEAPTLDSLAENAAIIVTGIVTSVDIHMSYTNYSFRTYEVIKGSLDQNFWLTTREGTNTHSSPAPVRFDQEQEVLLFLNENDGQLRVYWGTWGKRLLRAEKEENLDYLKEEFIVHDLGDPLGDLEFNLTYPVNETRRALFGGMGETVTFKIDPLKQDIPLFILISGLIYIVVFRKE